MGVVKDSVVNRRRRNMVRRVVDVVTRGSVVLLLTVSGCRFLHLELDKQRLKAHGKVIGEVHVSGPSAGPVYVAAFSAQGACREKKYCLSASQMVSDSNGYEFFLSKGAYFLFAFEDRNGNQDVDVGERSVGQAVEIKVGEQQTRRQNLRIDAVVTEEVVRKSRSAPWSDDRLVVVGEKASLDHRRFGRREAEAAVWRPTRAMYRYPAGLFVLDEVDPKRIPVLYVHGMGGYAQEFRPMIETLSRRRFQPWVFQYPGGLPLPNSRDALQDAIVEMTHRFDIRTVAVVAHSMGGLLARDTLGRNELSRIATCLVTIATPFGGVPSASEGVRSFPFVIPSWRDLDPLSPFIEQLYRHPLRPDTRYFLIDLQVNEIDDGVIPVASQRRKEALAEASTRRSYRYRHAEALAADDMIGDINAFLERCSERQDRADAGDGDRVVESRSKPTLRLR